MSSEFNVHKDFMEQLDKVLDVDTGLAYCCDSEEFYQEMLLTYLDD